MEYLNCSGSVITSDERCTREIASRIDMAKVTFNKKDTLYVSKQDNALCKKNNINSQLDATITNFIGKYNQLNMFRTIISSILRSTRLCLQLVV